MVETQTSIPSTFLENNTDRLSYKTKIKNDYEWARKKIDYYSNKSTFFSEKKEKYKINYDLYNGRFDFSSYIVTGNDVQENLGVLVPEIDINESDYIHFPILQTVLHDLVGEEIKRPFNLRVVSTNSNSESVRQRKTKELLVENVAKYAKEQQIQRLVIQNKQKLVEAQEQVNPQLDPNYVESLKKIEDNFMAQIEEMSNKMTPLEVETYMAKGFRLPEEKLMDEVLQYHIKTDRLKLIFDRGWEDVVITGEEIYWTGLVNGRPTIKRINPLYFNCSRNRDVIFYDEMDWSTYDEYLTVYDIYQRFGNDLKEEERKILDKYESPLSSTGTGKPWEVIPNIIQDMNNNYGMYNDPYDDNPEHNVKSKRIRVTHVVWKSLKKVKYIYRYNGNGSLEKTIVDETYVFNKSTDVKQEIIYVPEYWEGYKMFTNPKIFIHISPILNQYRDIDNPFQIRGPYTGAIFSSNNSNPVAIADLGKPWQFLYNVVINQIIELLKTDIGRILLGLSEQIPKGMTPIQWMSYIKKFKVALISATKDGDMRSLGIDPQYWKEINLSHTQEISQKIELLEYIERKMTQAMSYNPNRLGQQSPYETVANNQQSIIQSSNQTERWFYMHNYVKERTVENYMEVCKEAYKENPIRASYALSDLSIATLNTEVGDFANYNYKVYITNTLRDTEIVNQLKSLIQPIIQNSNGDMRIAAEITRSENATEIVNIIHRIQEQKEARETQQMQQQNQMQQQMQQMQMQMKQQELDFKERIADKHNDTIIKAADIGSDKFKRANDVDEDGENDMIEMQLLKNKDSREDELSKLKADKIRLENKKLSKEINQGPKKK